MSDQRSPSPISCKSCGAQLDIRGAEEIAECPYCGTKYSAAELLNESDAVRTERIKAQAEIELEAVRMKNAAEREAMEEEKAAVARFKKGKFSKFLIICAIISALVTVLELSDGFSLSGVIALIQAVLYLTAWLMGIGVFKGKKKSTHTLITILAFALILPFFLFFGKPNSSSRDSKPEEITWIDIEMHEALPEPEKLYGEIGHNSSTALILTLCEISEQEFKAYRDTCIDAGYSMDSDESILSYSAFNQDGYSIRLVFSESSEELNIYLDAPEELSEFEWPANGPGSILPATKSNIGNITWDNSETFIVHIGNTPIEEYREYVKACEAAGFIVDYSKDDEYYSALNADGYELTLRYLGFNIIEVSVNAPKDTGSTAAPEQTSAPENTEAPENAEAPETASPVESTAPSDELVNGMHPEFIEAMDSYEAFIDEYCDFMTKYIASDSSDAMLLLEYAEYVSKYAEMMEDFAAWEEEEMNDTETAYYIEVQTRVNARLLEVAL